uniref:Uncharacterized protein n=1 Tax=Arundo donax TaxID=35708 RepID=A0A0A8YCB4_ARUDO
MRKALGLCTGVGFHCLSASDT